MAIGKSIRRIITLILIATMLMSSTVIIPFSGVAESGEAVDEAIPFESVRTGATNGGAYVEEDISRRDQFTKHYITPDGKVYAVIFPEQVHYLQDGEWREVDNRLALDSEGKNYITAEGEFDVSFAKSASDASLVSITDAGYTLSWSVSFAKKVPSGSMTASGNMGQIASGEMQVIETRQAEVSSFKEEEGNTKSRITDLGRAISEVRYNKVFNDTVDLRYSLLHGKVEEDIIINSPEGFSSYTLTVDTDGLNALKHTDGSISFKTSEGETVFKLAAPWMKDANGEVSSNVAVVMRQKAGMTFVTYTPDASWLNADGRAYPVLIDPSFTTRFYTNNYEDTYVYTNDSPSTTRPSETSMKIGNLNGKDYYAYINILNIPELNWASSIQSVTLDFWVNTTSSPSLNVYAVTEEWSEDTICYSNQPSSILLAEDVIGSPNGSRSKYSVDLYEWLWYLEVEYGGYGDPFHDFDWNGLKIGYSSQLTNNHTEIVSSEYIHVNNYRPVMTVEYSYYPEALLSDNALYSLKNVSSGQYLTVDDEYLGNEDELGEEEFVDVYMAAKNDQRTQAFRLDIDADSVLTLATMSYGDGSGRLLSAAVSETSNRTDGNLATSAYIFEAMDSSGYPENQKWLIQPHDLNQGLYKIVMAADPLVALSTAGGVTVTAFTGAQEQLWKLESGGLEVIIGHNMRDDYISGQSNSISVGSTWLSYCCPVYDFGTTVTLSSSDTGLVEKT